MKVNYKSNQYAPECMIDGPVWTDYCGHEPEEYIASFECVKYKDGIYVIEQYDLYVYMDADEQHLCIRYGNTDSDYISPGNFFMFLRSGNSSYNSSNPYCVAREILQLFGKLTWTNK